MSRSITTNKKVGKSAEYDVTKLNSAAQDRRAKKIEEQIKSMGGST